MPLKRFFQFPLNKIGDLQSGEIRSRASFSELASSRIRHCASCIGDPTTKRGQYFQIGQIWVLVMVPFVMIVVQNIILMYQYLNEWTTKDKFQSNLLIGVQIGNIVHRLQVERGTTALLVSSGRDASLYSRLQINYDLSDEAIGNISSWPDFNISPDYDSRTELQQHIKRHRDELDPFNTTITAEIEYYSKIIDELLRWLSSTIQEARELDIWKSLVAYHFLILAKEAAGVERAMGSTYYARGAFPLADLLYYEGMRIRSHSFFQFSSQYSSLVQQERKQFLASKLYTQLQTMKQEIQFTSRAPSVEMGKYWFDNMTLYTEFLHEVRSTLLDETMAILMKNIKEAQGNVYTLVAMTIIVASTLLMTAYFSTKLVRYIQSVSSNLHTKTEALDLEKQRNEWLIHSILPPSVAQKLLRSEEVPPEQYDCVTIMFSDIVSFTQICAQSTALQVVLMLNMIYAEFDDTLDVYDAYKVETIGDAYMVSSGLPVRNGDRHIREIGLFSIHMQDVVRTLKISHLPKWQLQLRIGINSGPCVAGVVGHKSPRYCLFGDTVNTASRMESHGKPGLIHCSEASYQMLANTDEFIMSPRGVVEIKGKGQMSTWWLNGTKDPDKSPSKMRPRSRLGATSGETLVNLPVFSILSDNASLKSGITSLSRSRISVRSSLRGSISPGIDTLKV